MELCQDPHAEGIHGTEILQINEEETNEILLRIRSSVRYATGRIRTLSQPLNEP